jgi:hypothetical protein
VISKVVLEKWVFQLDKSTDTAGYSQMLVFVWCIKEKEILKEFLFSETLPLMIKGIDVFGLVTGFFLKYNIALEVCGSIRTHGTLAVVEKFQDLLPM